MTKPTQAEIDAALDALETQGGIVWGVTDDQYQDWKRRKFANELAKTNADVQRMTDRIRFWRLLTVCGWAMALAGWIASR